MKAPMTIKQYVAQMRKIPGGRFTMGRTYSIKGQSGFYSDEQPAHAVDLSTYRMGATLVTVGMWREYVRANEYVAMPKVPDWDWIDNHPIVNVSWNDIMGVDGGGGFCEWASRASGVSLSLPTEAQWENAAKGVKLNRKYPWGNNWEANKLWSSAGTAKKRTAPVVRTNNVYENPYGIVDLAGNTWQWCYDVYEEYGSLQRDRLGYPLVPANPKNEGVNPLTSQQRVLRGGSWHFDDPVNFRCTYRFRNDPNVSNSTFGFRLSAPA
jgi:formylglycine-generating enzyme required for sulfatase activity